MEAARHDIDGVIEALRGRRGGARVRAPVVTLLTDYGLADDFVGVCHGVIAGICPPARIIDITHGIPRHDVRTGAIVLADALPFMPEGVHVAVVDPDVGAEPPGGRSRPWPTASASSGPTTACSAWPPQAGGGVVQAVDIARSPLRLEPVSATFHGRDIFAAGGRPPGRRHRRWARPGRPVDPASLVTLELPRPRIEPAGHRGPRPVPRPVRQPRPRRQPRRSRRAAGLRLGHAHGGGGRRRRRARAVRAHLRRRRAPGELILYEDAYRRLAVAVSHGDAAASASGWRPATSCGSSRRDPRAPAPAPASDDLHQRPRARTGRAWGAAWDAGHRGGADGGPGPAGSGLDRAAGPALLCSLVLRASADRLLSLAAGVAVAEVAGPDAAIKWPNDVLVDGRKVAGHPGRGPAPGGLGGARDRRQRRRGPGGLPARAARAARARWAARAARPRAGAGGAARGAWSAG